MADRDSGEHGIGQDPTDVGDPGGEPRQPGEPANPEMRTADEPEVPGERRAPPEAPGRRSGPLRYIRSAFREVAWLVGMVAWLGFWLNVAHLHFREGAMPEAVLTTLLFALPAVLAYLLRLNAYFEVVEPPSLRSLTG